MLKTIQVCNLFILFLVLVTLAVATGVAAKPDEGPVTVASLEFMGEVIFNTETYFEDGSKIGGLSGITYDAQRGVYYSFSDDQGTFGPIRYYTLEIDVSDGSLDDGDIVFTDVTYLKDQNGELLAPFSLDPEGIFLARPGQLYFTSEGNTLAQPQIPPFVNRYNPTGKENRALPIPERYLPTTDGSSGIRFNLAFESLTATPDRRLLFTAVEGALFQDGPAADIGQESLARMLVYDLDSKQPVHEYVYVDNPVAEESDPPGLFRVNGLVELLALDNAGTFLAMERSFSVGAGNTVWLYEISTAGATDVSGEESLLSASFTPVSKRLLLDVEQDLGLVADNLEGLVFAPPLPDGRLPLIIVSDNNFSGGQFTQFIAMAVELVPAD